MRYLQFFTLTCRVFQIMRKGKFCLVVPGIHLKVNDLLRGQVRRDNLNKGP